MFIQVIDAEGCSVVLNMNLISSVDEINTTLYRVNMNNNDTFLIDNETYDDLIKCFKEASK